MKVPWAVPYIGEEELAEVTDAVRTNWLSMGRRVKEFEEQLSDYLGVSHVIAVSNGTIALDLALKVFGIGPGDEVILPAMTYIATLNSVLYQGATPVFADIELDTFNIDPADVERRITPKTRCIMCIDYGGNPADHEELRRIAQEHGLPLVQDAAQSMGGVYRGTPLGSQGDIAITSFHAAKVITSIEGGAILTNDDAVARTLRIMRNQGEDPNRKYIHVELGHNARLSDLHAAIGLAQWRKREAVFQRRQVLAETYTSHLADLTSVRLPVPRNNCFSDCPRRAGCCTNGWFFYPILVPERDRVAEVLEAEGVETRICYPMPVYEQPFYRRRDTTDGDRECPNADWVTKRVLNLPMYYALTPGHIEHVSTVLQSALMRLESK